MAGVGRAGAAGGRVGATNLGRRVWGAREVGCRAGRALGVVSGAWPAPARSPRLRLPVTECSNKGFRVQS